MSLKIRIHGFVPIILEEDRNVFKIPVSGSLRSLRYPSWSKITLQLREFALLRDLAEPLKAVARAEAVKGEDNAGYKICIIFTFILKSKFNAKSGAFFRWHLDGQNSS